MTSDNKLHISLRDPEALQARFARDIIARLAEQAEQTPHDVSERLRAAREQALDRARAARRAVPSEAGAVAVQPVGGGAAALSGFGGRHGSPWWLKLASLVPLVMLFGGLALIEQLHAQRQLDAAAEVDVALLADNLPPAAYSDPGFVEFLKTAQD
jgi:hypothetical protein